MGKSNLAAVVALVLIAATASAQAQSSGVARGVVTSATGEPVTGAEVRLGLLGAGGEPRYRLRTDGAGRWLRGGLETGVWQLEIEAVGYRPAAGKIEVSAEVASELPVMLEVDADVVVDGWLQQANEQLAAGQAAAAEAFYKQALTVVPAGQTAAIHRALARAYFLQDDIDASAEALQTAVLIDTTDSEARQLLAAVLDSRERGGEAVRWLELLDEQGVAAAARQAFGGEVPVRSLAAGSRGRFRSSVAGASPFSDVERLLARVGDASELGITPGAPWDPTAESFELYVPEGGAAEESYGLFVWISPTARGLVRDPEMLQALERQRMIWIGANNFGNSRPRGDRLRLALDAAHAVAEAYPVDRARVYVGGYSGGGRMASAAALLYPEVFAGGVYFMGVDFYRNVAVPDQPGILWGAVLPSPPPEVLAATKARSRFVFITGSHDFNRAQTHAYYHEYHRDGLDRATLIEIPGVGHYYGFRAAELEQSITALDDAGQKLGPEFR